MLAVHPLAGIIPGVTVGASMAAAFIGPDADAAQTARADAAPKSRIACHGGAAGKMITTGRVVTAGKLEEWGRDSTGRVPGYEIRQSPVRVEGFFSGSRHACDRQAVGGGAQRSLHASVKGQAG